MAHAGSVDFWFDYSCPYAYLASTQVEAFAARTGAELRYRPMLLGGVFRAHGTPQNLSEVLSPAKARHNLLDMHRWAAHFGVPLTMPPGHPLRTVEALRATLVTGTDPRVVHGFYRAYWVEGRAPSDPQTIRDVVSAAGHDADRVLAEMDAQRDTLRALTDEAISLGIFGAPAFVVGDQMFWGQDRMHFVERALSRGARMSSEEPGKRSPVAHTLDFYWDFSSPFSYLAATQAEAFAQKHGAELRSCPMLLGAVFKAVGTADAPLMTWSEAKRRHAMMDMQRWSDHWGAPFRFPTRFPMNTVKALRAYLALPESRQKGFRDGVFKAYWADDKDIASDAVLLELLGEGGAEVLAKTQTQEIKDQLFAATKRAVDAGVFGAPTWVVDGTQLFWGQDRLPLVEDALRKA